MRYIWQNRNRWVLLLVVFMVFIVAIKVWRQAVFWKYPLVVVIYPINGDGLRSTQMYIDAQSPEHFEAISHFIQQQWLRYQPKLAQPVQLILGPSIDSTPPNAPVGNKLVWSLMMRWWSWRHDSVRNGEADVRLYLQYFSPLASGPLEHSLGMSNGRIGLVNCFASVDFQARNNLVATHELLHTLGATDKYHPQSLQPYFPAGFAKPHAQPLYPQQQAAIMAGSIPLTQTITRQALSLLDVTINTYTATEIGWIP